MTNNTPELSDLDIAVRAHKHDASHLDPYITLKEQCEAANSRIIERIKEYRYYSARREIDRINRIINEA